MKRTVILDPTHPGWAGPQPDPALCRRLTGHLAARLREYAEEGISPVEIVRDGLVQAKIMGLDAGQTVSDMARQRVFCQSKNGILLFAIGAGTSFEDLDYVQSVVAGLLE